MGFCQAPLGVSGGLMLVTLPQLLAAKHVPEPVIAGVETWGLITMFCAFLLSPLLDWRFSRRFYAIVFAVLTAAFMFSSYLMLDNIPLLSLFQFLGGAAITLHGADIGGWIDGGSGEQPALGAWMTAANIGAGGLTVMVAILLLRHLPYVLGDATLASHGLLPLALFPSRPAGNLMTKSWPARVVRDLFPDMCNRLKNPSVRKMLLVVAQPPASLAPTNILGSRGGHYGASEETDGVIRGAERGNSSSPP